MSVWDPVNPMEMTASEYAGRLAIILEATKIGAAPDIPLRPGYFRCFVCRREAPMEADIQEIGEEFRRRWGHEAEDPVLVCSACETITRNLYRQHE